MLLISNLKLPGSFLIIALLLTSFFCFQPSNAVTYTPDVSVVRISQYDCWTSGMDEWGDSYSYMKLVPGYTVTVYNGGNGASGNTTMNFYVKTFDGKVLVKYLKVPALNPGQAKRISFSCNAGTDGSFKEGYVIINPDRALKESNYVNNIRKFTLKEVFTSTNKTNVTEYGKVNTTVLTQKYAFYETYSYNCPIGSYENINRVVLYLEHPYDYFYNVTKIRAEVPSSLANNVTFQFNNKHYKPSVVDNNTVELNLSPPRSDIWQVAIWVNGTNLEDKSALSEPLQVINSSGSDLSAGTVRYVWEYYILKTYKWVDGYQTFPYKPGANYYTHLENVTKIVVNGDTAGRYTAGWFITPVGSFNSIKAFYGNSEEPATLISNGRYGISHRMRDISTAGYIIEGTNLKGFRNFKGLGFSSWTWRT